jgi:hypothetical protein
VDREAPKWVAPSARFPVAYAGRIIGLVNAPWLCTAKLEPARRIVRRHRTLLAATQTFMWFLRESSSVRPSSFTRFDKLPDSII